MGSLCVPASLSLFYHSSPLVLSVRLLLESGSPAHLRAGGVGFAFHV